jgi:hypothetical protein
VFQGALGHGPTPAEVEQVATEVCQGRLHNEGVDPPTTARPRRAALPCDGATTIDLIERYLLQANSATQAWIFGRQPLLQPVVVNPGEWSAWVESLPFQGPTYQGLKRALARIRDNSGTVDWLLLTDLSETVGESAADRVACWFATMLWSSRPANRSRTRQWRRAISPELHRDLQPSWTAVANRHLEVVLSWVAGP